jgi:glycerate kinase
MGVARRAAALGVPTIAIVGSTGPGAEDCVNHAKGGLLHSYVNLADRFGMDDALREPAKLIEQVAHEIVSDFNAI